MRAAKEGWGGRICRVGIVYVHFQCDIWETVVKAGETVRLVRPAKSYDVRAVVSGESGFASCMGSHALRNQVTSRRGKTRTTRR